MKKQITILGILLTISITLFSQASWEPVISPVSENLVSVCFVDAQNGWILSDEGTLISTVDGGQSWQTTDFDSGNFTSVYFTDQNHGCIVGWQDSSFILRTTDGGGNWSDIDHLKAEHLNDVFFINENTGWAVGLKDNMNYTLSTSDGGENWAEQSSMHVLEGELYSINFRDEMKGTACGYYGMFLITSTGGSSWALNVSIPQLGENLNSVYNWDATKGCVVGTSGLALYTVNTWGQYVETNTNTTEELNGISAVEGTNKVWAVGTNGAIIYTSSYILGWVAQNSGVTENLIDIDMVEENNGWAVGENGTILHYSLGSSVEENAEEICFIYPNPTHGKIYIEFYQEEKVNEIILIDITGKIVSKMIDSEYQQQIAIDAPDLLPGIYFLRIKTDRQHIDRKINIY